MVTAVLPFSQLSTTSPESVKQIDQDGAGSQDFGQEQDQLRGCIKIGQGWG